MGYSQLTITFETGIVSPGYNDVRAPNEENNQGSLFSLSDDFEEVETPIYFRAEARYLIASKHTIELTAVPLHVSSRDFTGSEIRFEDATYSGEDINGDYI